MERRIKMVKINALGKVCPLPVIETKKALEENDTVETTVDNEIAAQNLKKMAGQLGYDYQVEQNDAQSFTVRISKKKGEVASIYEQELTRENDIEDNYIVIVDTNTMGQGSKELGKQLLKMFIYSLTEQPDLPEKIIFYNGGVHLVSDNSDSLEDLQILAENGVEIYACGACLNYYNLSEKCKVGEVTNMYHIIEMMRKSKKIIKP